MATVNTIGTTGRDYSTLQAWEDAIPATPTGGYEGYCYNDSEFTAGVIIDGHTTSSSNYIKLSTGSGQSFIDNAGAATNPQYYDQSKGVGIRATVAFDSTISVLDGYVTVEKLQILVDDFFGDCYSMDVFENGNVLRNCILVNSKAHVFNQIGMARGGVIANNLMVIEGAGQEAFYIGGNLTDRVIFVANAMILTGTNTGTNALLRNAFTDGDMTNCAFFGFAAISATTDGTLNFTYCGTDLSSGLGGGTGNQHSLTFANQYVSTTNDFRLKAGNSMLFGTSTTTYTAGLDIIGQSQPGSTPWYVGQWAFQTGGGNINVDIDAAGAITVAGKTIAAGFSQTIGGGVIGVAGQTISSRIDIAIENGAITVAGQSVTATFNGDISLGLTNGAMTISGQSLGSGFSQVLSNGAITVAGQTITAAIDSNISVDISSPGNIIIRGQDLVVTGGGGGDENRRGRDGRRRGRSVQTYGRG